MTDASSWWRHRLARRLALLIVLASSAIALLITAAQLTLEFKRDVGYIHERFTQVEEAYLPSIVQNVWVVDPARLHTLLEGIHRLPDFEFAEVRVDGKPFASSGERPASAELIRRFPLTYEYRGQVRDIGQLEVGASLDGPIRRTWERLWFVLLLNALKTALVAALIFLLVRRMITQPLDRITGDARRLAGGDLAQPLTLPVTRLSAADDEIHGLARHLDEMRQSLMQRHAGMAAMNRELEQAVREREAALEQLRQAHAEIGNLNEELEARVRRRTSQLEAANAALESFSYSVSHDLRAPLRAIDGFVAILAEDYAPRLDDEGRRLLKVVSDSADKLGQLIGDILAFSRAGRHELSVSPIDMTALVREVWQVLEPQRRERQVELRLGELPQACGDIVALRQVWQNLLANALKFTRGRAPAVIEISGESTATEVLYQVRDNGAGFDPTYAAKLFGPFQRLHNASEFEGTGIGLTIVKRFIAMHDGRVWAEGKPDAGARFGFALPVDRQCGADRAVPQPER
ncbi:MAG: ATP-binding protein [Sulfuritalea sp.]|nr:ATP-binding protein [Sulfuritalea sp.]MDP1982695.1 ATP-binding protein [Sulfuritalea sp.]